VVFVRPRQLKPSTIAADDLFSAGAKVRWIGPGRVARLTDSVAEIPPELGGAAV